MKLTLDTFICVEEHDKELIRVVLITATKYFCYVRTHKNSLLLEQRVKILFCYQTEIGIFMDNKRKLFIGIIDSMHMIWEKKILSNPV